MFFRNFFIFLYIYYCEACYKLPDCDYTIFETQIKILKYENKQIKERLNMLEAILDNQTEFLIVFSAKIYAMQQTIKDLDSKISGSDHNTPPTTEVATTPKDDDDDDDLEESDVCPIDYFPSDCSQSHNKFCGDVKCRIQNRLYSQLPFMVSCDHSNGGGWTVIQRRTNGGVDFYRIWSEYKNGFGNIDGEFFIGLDKLYALTNTIKSMQLFIMLQNFEGEYKFAKYDRFVVGSELESYKLIQVGKYSGDAGDSFSQHQGCYFTTKDRDNDMEDKFNCAAAREGAWWYKKCFWSNLNGKYYDYGKVPRGKAGISWGTFKGYNYSLKYVQMMIKPRLRT